MKEARPLRDVLAEVARASGLRRKRELGGVNGAWAEASGENCARHSRVAAVKQGVLHVVVDSSACLHEMAGFRKAEILENLRTHDGCSHIYDIRFKMGSMEKR
jgi:predicted nucleic acid-binding Zn ribbon protein